MNNKFLIEIEEHVVDYYKKFSSEDYFYHTLDHVINVVKLVEEIGVNSEISDEDIEILKIAAWFHDIGHIDTWEGHEEKSAEYANFYLLNKNYSQERIEKVKGCILATIIPHKPKNILEEIICDADIAYIGSTDFFNSSDLLKIEIEKRKRKIISQPEWLLKNIDFLQKNKFFTKYAVSKFEETKNSNLLILKEKYQKVITHGE
jgi:predicted metal-dependent HD superfamily phosphohydrolase